MADNVVTSLLIAFGVDSTELNEGITEAEGKVKGLGEVAQKAGDGIKRGLTQELEKFIKTAIPIASVTAAFYSMARAQQTLFNAQKASNELGVPADEYMAWGRAAENLGYSAESAQGAIASLTTSMQEAALTGRSQAAGAMTYLGVSLFNAKGQMKSAADVMQDLSRVFSEMPVEKARVYGQMVGLSPNTVALLREGKDLAKEYAEQLQTGPTTEQAKIAFEVQKSWNKMSQAGSDLARNLFVTVAPALIKVLEVFRDISRFVANNSDFVIYGAGALVLAKNIGTLSKAFQLLGIVGAKAILAIGTAMKAHPFLLVISGIVAGLYSLSAWFKGESSVIGSFFESLGVKAENVKALFKVIGETIKTILTPFAWLINAIGSLLNLTPEGVLNDESRPTMQQLNRNWLSQTDEVYDQKNNALKNRALKDDDKNQSPNGTRNLIVRAGTYQDDVKAMQRETALPQSVVNRNTSNKTLNSQVHNEITINAPNGNPAEIRKSVGSGIGDGMSGLNGLVANFQTGYISK